MKRIPKKREAEIIKKYSHVVLKKLKEIKENENLTEFCRNDLDNINPSKIYEFLSGRPITANYMSVFMNAGLVTLKELLEEKAMTDLPKDEQVVLKRLTIKSEIVELICFLEEQGVDVTQILRGHARAWYPVLDEGKGR